MVPEDYLYLHALFVLFCFGGLGKELFGWLVFLVTPAADRISQAED